MAIRIKMVELVSPPTAERAKEDQICFFPTSTWIKIIGNIPKTVVLGNVSYDFNPGGGGKMNQIDFREFIYSFFYIRNRKSFHFFLPEEKFYIRK